jgi:hypothetical protein
MIGERAIEISQTYGRRRTVTVDRVPALEVNYEGESEIAFERDVCERVDVLVQRAYRTSQASEQRVTYSASDPAPWSRSGV